ncbi:response regulator transcription factor [Actinomadura kijaniata]|uniref:DNA-binding NarL/FixJ family response regulator n=1 Tax=Actinomadura namibiensis TaxID=182080 RepID=A0A7W3LRR5_ACTNM|nr:response regulator transcription factor [Actinomadura namibiensis]MBA8953017.1 DNA-binding NarL/FixJ family response regulator [Actinomadura namibiensis]
MRLNAAGGVPGTVRVVVVDDHPVVRAGLLGMLGGEPGFEVVAEAADGAEAIAAVARTRPDVVLSDLRMPGLDGVELIRRLAETAPRTRVLVLTTYDGADDVIPAIDAGAVGYLLKDSPREELFRGLRAAARGESVLAPSAAARLIERVRSPARPPGGPLSEREIEVLALVAGGASNRMIAAELFISEATVKTHLVRIFAKLGVSDRTAAAIAAHERGLLP